MDSAWHEEFHRPETKPACRPRQLEETTRILPGAKPQSAKVLEESSMPTYLFRCLVIGGLRLITISIVSFIIIQLPTCSQDFLEWPTVRCVQQVPRGITAMSHPIGNESRLDTAM